MVSCLEVVVVSSTGTTVVAEGSSTTGNTVVDTVLLHGVLLGSTTGATVVGVSEIVLVSTTEGVLVVSSTGLAAIVVDVVVHGVSFACSSTVVVTYITVVFKISLLPLGLPSSFVCCS